MALGAFSRLFAPSTALLMTISGGGTVRATDPIPAPITAGPAVVAAPEAFPAYPASGTVGCAICGYGHRSLFHHNKIETPRVPCICPGACFGYFPTQWSRWENVCPIPYPGAGLTDAPPRPAPPPVVPSPAPKDTNKGSDTPLKKKAAPAIAPEPTTLPTIPQLPSKTSKF